MKLSIHLVLFEQLYKYLEGKQVLSYNCKAFNDLPEEQLLFLQFLTLGRLFHFLKDIVDAATDILRLFKVLCNQK